MANVTAEEIDMIIFATLTPDMIIPSAACVLQSELRCLKTLQPMIYKRHALGLYMDWITAASYISSGIYKKYSSWGRKFFPSSKLE